MKTIDLIITGALGLVVLGLSLQLTDIQSATNVSQYYSAKTIPVAFIGSTLALLGAIILRDLFASARHDDDGGGGGATTLLRPRRLIFLAAAILYVLLFQPLGFLVASLLFLTSTAVFLGTGRLREFFISAGVAVVTIGFVYLVVVYGLESFLPEFDLGS